ncbi:MAG: hypothetical protein U0401_19360 [Anaerolineae bacterium]
MKKFTLRWSKPAFPRTPPLSALFIGEGGYTFPRYWEVIHPGSHIEVIEIDPGVTATAMNGLGAPHRDQHHQPQ